MENNQKPIYELTHTFQNPFQNVAMAFWKKYQKNDLSMGTITIAEVKQETDDKFTFVRRLNGDGGKEEYKVISFERSPNKISISTLCKDTVKNARILAETAEYLGSENDKEVKYKLSVFKEMKFRWIRELAFNWGISRMQDYIKQFPKK